MTTSANVIEYTIYKGKEQVGRFSKHLLCKYPDYAELLKYQPLNEYTIQAWGYDEEEDEWEENPENLEKFLKGMILYNKWLRDYFNGTKTAEQIQQELVYINDEMVRKMNEGFAKRREEFKNKNNT
jgi:hypothetical protein